MRISDWSSDLCSSDLEKQLQRLQMLVEVERTNHRNDFPGRQSGHQSTSAARCSRGRIEEHTMLLGRSTVLKHMACRTEDRKRVVSGKRVSVRLDIGGRRNIKKKTQIRKTIDIN